MWWKNGFNWFWKNRVNKWLYAKREKPFSQKSKEIDYSKFPDLEIDLFRWRIEMILWNEELLEKLRDKRNSQEPWVITYWTIAHDRREDLDKIKDDKAKIIIVWSWFYYESLITKLIAEDLKKLLEGIKK